MSIPGRHAAVSRRHALARQARQAVLAALAAFAGIQLAADVAIQGAAPDLIDPNHGALLRRVHESLEAAPPQAHLVVALGTSRTFIGLHAPLLQESLSPQLARPVCVANLGVMGAGHVDELLAWRRLRRDRVRPDLVLIEVAPAYLSDVETGVETCRIPASRINWRDLGVIQHYQRGWRQYLWCEAGLTEAGAFYSYRSDILRAVAPQLLPPGGPADYSAAATPHLQCAGFPVELRSNLTEGVRQTMGKLAPYVFVGSRGCDALQEMLTACRNEGVPAALVVMPEGPEFRSWYRPGKLSEVRAWLEQLCREQGAGLVYAEDWFDDDAFADSQHLLRPTAMAFTERLGREYLLPWLHRLETGRPLTDPTP